MIPALGLGYKLLPRTPPLRAVEAPAAYDGAGEEQRRHRAVDQLHAMGLDGLAVDGLAREACHRLAVLNMLQVTASQDYRGVIPRVIVERAVVVRPQEAVQVDVGERVPRHDEPAL